uniref:Uncharacterized protein n=1 Tax=Cacopsylla melanoneura TaxID=428564 RepID=A0A8D8ZLT7_9HEMI
MYTKPFSCSPLRGRNGERHQKRALFRLFFGFTPITQERIKGKLKENKYPTKYILCPRTIGLTLSEQEGHQKYPIFGPVPIFGPLSDKSGVHVKTVHLRVKLSSND